MDCSHGTRRHIFSEKVRSNLYEKFHRNHVLPHGPTANELPLGSVFGLDFSLEGDYVVTVLAGRAFEIHDPRVRRKIHSRQAAHDDCVNCVTFIDHRQFATCSDDSTIRLWDFRNIRFPLGVLRGHRNWVKNIEYDGASGLLFSIAFQDGVRYWNIENPAAYSTGEDVDNLLVTLDNPVRMRLAPDGSKMFVSSRKSQCLIINDFDGTTLTNSEIQDFHKSFFENRQITNNQVQMSRSENLKKLHSNRPSVYTLCGHRGIQKYRIVLSVSFHPKSGDYVAMRYTDVGNGRVQQELTSLFDLRQENYTPFLGAQQTHHKYLRYLDDNSPDDSRDYIKEISFSRDGRVLASPHENGVRLLSIDSHCTSPDIYFDSRYSSQHKEDYCPDFEQVLDVPTIHLSPVLTCKFARNDFILASGSLAGTVAFTSPQI